MLQKFVTVHHRHLDIQQNYADCLSVSIQLIQTFSAVFGSQNQISIL